MCGLDEDCEEYRVAASRDEVSRPHGKACRQCTRAAMMCDDAGQQGATRPAASAARAEVAQESRDE